MKTLACLVLLILLVALTACGGSSTTMPPPPPPPPVANASVTVQNTTGAAFDVAMSTSFQPAEWDYKFFQNFPGATTPLANFDEGVRLGRLADDNMVQDNWIANHGFGYLTIPTLALTAFLLLIGFLVLASAGEAEATAAPATLPAHAER